jgi:tetratricopeptide (TPR) repeat protein
LYEKRDFDKAITDFTEAIRCGMNSSLAFSARALAKNFTRQYGEAIEDFTEALRLDPKDTFALSSFAWFLASCPLEKNRDGKQAVQLATTACELTEWKNHEYLDVLAMAYAEAGDFESVVKFENKAIDGLPKGEGFFHPNYLQHLKLFKKKQPYHQPSPID